MRIRFVVLLAGLATAGLAQAPEAFEVASIHQNMSGLTSSGTNTDGGYWIATNTTASSFVLMALDHEYAQTEGIPSWASSERYDVRGRIPSGATEVSFERLRGMIESLLVERFQLKYHHETRQQQIYVLTVGKSGLKAKKADPDEPQSSRNSFGERRAETNRQASTIQDLAEQLRPGLKRMVLDQTGLTDRYDLHLVWSPNPLPDSELPSLPTALEDQLGLKLTSTTGPVDFVVVDRYERPSEN